MTSAATTGDGNPAWFSGSPDISQFGNGPFLTGWDSQALSRLCCWSNNGTTLDVCFRVPGLEDDSSSLQTFLLHATLLPNHLLFAFWDLVVGLCPFVAMNIDFSSKPQTDTHCIASKMPTPKWLLLLAHFF